jgi:hypothetical protein
MGLKGVKQVNFLRDAKNKFNSGFGEIICQDYREVDNFLLKTEKIVFQDLGFPFIGFKIEDPTTSTQNLIALQGITGTFSLKKLYGICKYFGIIKSCKLMTDPFGKNLGSAEITYSSREEAETA